MKFKVDLKNAFSHEKIESCIKFDEVFVKVLNRHAPLKKKILIIHDIYLKTSRIERSVSASFFKTTVFPIFFSNAKWI